MSYSGQDIEQEWLDVDVARLGSTAFDVATGTMGGLAIRAIFVERNPLKAVLFGAVAAGLGLIAYSAGNVHEDYARHLGALETQRSTRS